MCVCVCECVCVCVSVSVCMCVCGVLDWERSRVFASTEVVVLTALPLVCLTNCRIV